MSWLNASRYKNMFSNLRDVLDIGVRDAVIVMLQGLVWGLVLFEQCGW